MMKFAEPRAYTAPEKAARRLVEIASTIDRPACMHLRRRWRVAPVFDSGRGRTAISGLCYGAKTLTHRHDESVDKDAAISSRFLDHELVRAAIAGIRRVYDLQTSSRLAEARVARVVSVVDC
jgi:hypothetical protein